MVIVTLSVATPPLPSRTVTENTYEPGSRAQSATEGRSDTTVPSRRHSNVNACESGSIVVAVINAQSSLCRTERKDSVRSRVYGNRVIGMAPRVAEDDDAGGRRGDDVGQAVTGELGDAKGPDAVV